MYLTLDSKQKIVTDKSFVLKRIKDNLTFPGIAKLNESCMTEDKSLLPMYQIFENNLSFNLIAFLSL